MLLYALAALIGVLVVFILWRWMSVARGARARDERILTLLDPLGEKLARGEPVAVSEVESVAATPHNRPLLFEMLATFERQDLFPERYRDRESHAEGMLTYWMAHPNELQDYPESLALLDTVSVDWFGEPADFLVYKYLMPEGHWARSEGWQLGVVGPYSDADPYAGSATAFSRASDKVGKVEPADLVDWFVSMLKEKGGHQPVTKRAAG